MNRPKTTPYYPEECYDEVLCNHGACVLTKNINEVICDIVLWANKQFISDGCKSESGDKSSNFILATSSTWSFDQSHLLARNTIKQDKQEFVKTCRVC